MSGGRNKQPPIDICPDKGPWISELKTGEEFIGRFSERLVALQAMCHTARMPSCEVHQVGGDLGHGIPCVAGEEQAHSFQNHCVVEGCELQNAQGNITRCDLTGHVASGYDDAKAVVLGQKEFE